MNIEKSKRLNEIENRILSINEELKKLRDEKLSLELEHINVVGKYMKLGERGYMFVTYQNIESAEIWLRGFYFKGNAGLCLDDFYFEYDAECSLYISSTVFIREYTETNEIHEITEEEFKNKYHELLESFKEINTDMLEKCKKTIKKLEIKNYEQR